MRIATSFIHQTANNDIQRAQFDLFTAQRQAGTEKKAHDLKGFEGDAQALITARSYLSKTQAYGDVSAELGARLATQDLALGSAAQAAQDVRLALTDAVGLDKGVELMPRVKAAFATALSAVNMTHAGKYVFGGVRDDQPPLNVGSLEELADTGSTTAVVQSADRKASAQIDERTVVDVAPVAGDFAVDLFEAMRRIEELDRTIGPFGEELTAGQRTNLEAEIAALATVVEGLHGVQAANGGVQSQVETLSSRRQEQENYFERYVGELENVNLAEVASDITQAQLRLEAAAQVYGAMRESSLLNLLR